MFSIFFFKRKKRNYPLKRIKKSYDIFLLDSLNQTRLELKDAQETRNAVEDYYADDMQAQIKLDRRKYFYLYRIARARHVHSGQIQPSAFDD